MPYSRNAKLSLPCVRAIFHVDDTTRRMQQWYQSFSLGGGQRADDPRFASKARDARFFGMSYSEKCPPSDLVREVGKMSVEGGAPPLLGGGGVHLCGVISKFFTCGWYCTVCTADTPSCMTALLKITTQHSSSSCYYSQRRHTCIIQHIFG